MKLIISITIIILFNINISFSQSDQPEVEWVNTYGGNWTDKAYKLIQSSDSNYVFIGMSLSYTQGYGDLYIIGLDNNGDTLWSQLYGGTNPTGRILAREIITTYDNGFFICGTNTNFSEDSIFYALKTNSIGEEIWHTTIVGKTTPKSVVQTLDSGFILVGYTFLHPSHTNYVSFVLKLNQTGDSLWMITYGTPSYESTSLSEIIKMTNGQYMAKGSYYNDDSLSGGSIYALIEEDGSIQWTRNNLQSSNNLNQWTDSTIVIAGSKDYYPTIWILDTLGNLIDEHQFGDSSEKAIDAFPLINKGIIICTEKSYFDGETFTSSRLWKFDSLLNQEWVLPVGNTYDELGSRSIAQTFDGGFIFGGACSNHSTKPDQDYYALKLMSEIPSITKFYIDDLNPNLHTVNHTPQFIWSYSDPKNLGQYSYELQVGIDNDWLKSEMWASGIVSSSDTNSTYNGLPLIDGETYFIRIHINNSQNWSPWYNTTFRMNTAPTIPIPIYPLEDEVTGSNPVLWIENSSDTEGDLLTYDFYCVVDTTYGEPDPVEVFEILEETDSTGWQVTEPLDENKRYFWKTRSYDGYEYSEWTNIFSSTFFVNETPEPPTAFQALSPPDTGNIPEFDMLTNFMWTQSYDPDPFDTVKYTLKIAIDSNFTYVNTIDSIESSHFLMTDSLEFGTHYWWKIEAFDKDGLTTQSTNTPDFWTWMLGDVNHDHDVNVSDLVYMVDYLFKGGVPIEPEYIGDVDHTCTLNVADIVYMVDFLFKGGADPLIGCE